MKYIGYTFCLIALTIQLCPVNSKNSIMLKISPLNAKADESELVEEPNIHYDPSWLKDHPDREKLIKNFKAWDSCLHSKHTKQGECDQLYEILVSPAQLIIDKMQHLKELTDVVLDCLNEQSQDECALEHADKMRIIKDMKTEMYPWTTIYEICIAAATRDFCASHIKFLHLPEYRVMKPQDLILITYLSICGSTEKSIEECLEGFEDVPLSKMEEKLEQKRSADEL